jgi:hypothetical protein
MKETQARANLSESRDGNDGAVNGDTQQYGNDYPTKKYCHVR